MVDEHSLALDLNWLMTIHLDYRCCKTCERQLIGCFIWSYSNLASQDIANDMLYSSTQVVVNQKSFHLSAITA